MSYSIPKEIFFGFTGPILVLASLFFDQPAKDYLLWTSFVLMMGIGIIWLIRMEIEERKKAKESR